MNDEEMKIYTIWYFVTNNYFISPLQLNQSFIADTCCCSKLMIPNKIPQKIEFVVI